MNMTYLGLQMEILSALLYVSIASYTKVIVLRCFVKK